MIVIYRPVTKGKHIDKVRVTAEGNEYDETVCELRGEGFISLVTFD